ncbi:MAG: hypothetical protein HRF49_09655 [bacterium]|jgi:putative CRISPR-associated protein (TIGR02619 family)
MANIHLICTVGTSYVKNLEEAYGCTFRELPEVAKLAELEIDKGIGHLMASSAEINSTVNVFRQIEGNVRKLILFVSDTSQGRFAGELYESVFPALFKGKFGIVGIDSVETVVIEGLKPDFESFRDEGVNNLKRQLFETIKSIRATAGCEAAINATGGYKAVGIISGFVAQILGCDVWYQFSELDAAIRISRPDPQSAAADTPLNIRVYHVQDRNTMVGLVD